MTLQPFEPEQSWEPRELPKLRSALLRLMAHEIDAKGDNPDAPSAPPELLEGLGRDDAMLIWIDPDMVELTDDAVRTLTEVTLGDVVWPASSGIVALGRPVVLDGFPADKIGDDRQVPRTVRGFAWCTVGSEVCIAALEHFDTDLLRQVQGGPASRVDERMRRAGEVVSELSEQLGCRPRAFPIGAAVYPLDRLMSDHDPLGAQPRIVFGAFLVTLWALMTNDGIATTRTQEPSRAEVRKAKRAGRRVPEVRIIEIRTGTSTAQAYAGTSREYRHRWVVRGHMRRQWMPSLGEHRLRFIAPHLKGPDGAPLIGGEKVHVFKGN